MSSVREARVLWAHQLHANLLNTIGAAILQSQICEQAVRSALPTSVDEVVRLRQILHALEEATRAMAAGLAEQPSRDLVREVRSRTHAFAQAHPDLTVRLTVRGHAGALSRRVATGAAIVLVEALANAARHAAPRAVDVDLTVDHASILLWVRDDGRGFDLAADGTPGLGLAIMRQWADALRGRLAVSSVPGRGTQVTLHVPVKHTDAHR